MCYLLTIAVHERITSYGAIGPPACSAPHPVCSAPLNLILSDDPCPYAGERVTPSPPPAVQVAVTKVYKLSSILSLHDEQYTHFMLLCTQHYFNTQVSTGLFNTTYGIPRATTIPADNTEHKVLCNV